MALKHIDIDIADVLLHRSNAGLVEKLADPEDCFDLNFLTLSVRKALNSIQMLHETSAT